MCICPRTTLMVVMQTVRVIIFEHKYHMHINRARPSPCFGDIIRDICIESGRLDVGQQRLALPYSRRYMLLNYFPILCIISVCDIDVIEWSGSANAPARSRFCVIIIYPARSISARACVRNLIRHSVHGEQFIFVHTIVSSLLYDIMYCRK